MDVFGYVERLPAPGETLRGSRLAYAPGGKGANQAVAAARAGREACASPAPAAATSSATSSRRRSATTGWTSRGSAASTWRPGVALILVDDAGENQIVAIPGANDSVGPPAPDAEVDVWLVQAEIPLDAVEGTLAAARATGATAVVNPSPAGRIPAALVAGYDIAIVNETELDALGGEHPPHVVVTLGERGVRILPEGTELPALPARVLDTTGAGDALAGAAAAALAEGRSLEDALEWGIATASLAVERPGCQPAMPRRAEVEDRMRGGGRG